MTAVKTLEGQSFHFVLETLLLQRSTLPFGFFSFLYRGPPLYKCKIPILFYHLQNNNSLVFNITQYLACLALCLQIFNFFYSVGPPSICLYIKHLAGGAAMSR